MSEGNLINGTKNVKKLECPMLIRYSEAVQFLWGDKDAHQVSDWIYGRYDLLGQWPAALATARETAAREGGMFTIRGEDCCI